VAVARVGVIANGSRGRIVVPGALARRHDVVNIVTPIVVIRISPLLLLRVAVVVRTRLGIDGRAEVLPLGRRGVAILPLPAAVRRLRGVVPHGRRGGVEVSHAQSGVGGTGTCTRRPITFTRTHTPAATAAGSEGRAVRH